MPADDTPEDALAVELAQMSGDPAVARQVRRALQRLADSSQKDVAEFARDVLAERTTLRSLARSSAYGEPFLAGFQRYQKWHDGLTPEERQKLIPETGPTD